VTNHDPLSGAAIRKQPYGVLFVCTGNICRSPLAKFVFLDLIAQRGVTEMFTVDSCGTYSGHAGQGADPRTQMVAKLHGLDTTHTARPLRPFVDFDDFDLLLAMDRSHMTGMLRGGAPPEKVRMMRSFDPALAGRSDAELDVPDPYYGGERGFEENYQMLVAACEGMLNTLMAG
jgi:protein-tyrosine phosphatase